MNVYKKSLELHKKLKGKIEVKPKKRIFTQKDLSLVYTPGVAKACMEISKNPSLVYDLTVKGNTVAVITDGSAVLGLGNIGAKAALPVMEGKCVIFKEMAEINAFPIALNTQNVDKIVETVKLVSPVFGGINLEDISAPRCFEIEEKLQDIGIPVFHDDQHGTAIVVLAALMNAAKLAEKEFGKLKVVIAGAGAAGLAIAKLLSCMEFHKKICMPVGEIISVDINGVLHKKRTDLNKYQKELLNYINPNNVSGSLSNALKNADVFIGVSTGNILTGKMIELMAKKPIVFAMANPVPEIHPKTAEKHGAFIVGTGRSDYKNQINNSLAFPGVFRGALNAKAKKITNKMKLAAAKALSKCKKNPSKNSLLPNTLNKKVVKKISKTVEKTAKKEKNI